MDVKYFQVSDEQGCKNVLYTSIYSKGVYFLVQTQPDKNVRIPIEATVKLYDSSSRYGVFNPPNRDTTTVRCDCANMCVLACVSMSVIL